MTMKYVNMLANELKEWIKHKIVLTNSNKYYI